MKEKSAVLISRLWANPEIKINVNVTGISIELSLDDYLNAVLEKLGSPAFIMRKGTLASKVKSASREVISEMKKETERVV